MNLVTNTHSAIVYDFGTSSIKLGLGGYSIPFFRISQASARQNRAEGEPLLKFGEEWLQRSLPDLEVVPMLGVDGSWLDQDTFTPFMDWTYALLGDIEPTDYAALFSQPSGLLSNPDMFKKRRRAIAEGVFEFGNHPSLCFQHDSTLACYSFAQETGVVVDFGWSCIRVIPVLEGHPLRRSARTHTLGGYGLASLLERKLSECGKVVRTHLDPKPNDGFGGLFEQRPAIVPTRSQEEFCRKSVLIDMIKSTLHFIPRKHESIKDYVYFMAGREPIDIENEIKVVGQQIFESHDGEKSLQETIVEAVMSTPKEIRDAFWEAIMPSGGLARLEGFNARLQNELTELVPDCNPKVLEPVCREASGENAVWAGGSIVASYERFPELCIMRTEWDECGESILDRKCL